MGLTLIAILTAALLLPGLVATRAFFWAAQTKEFDAPLPTLASSEGISLVGIMSVIVHFLYSALLRIVIKLPHWTSLPLADPYILLAEPTTAIGSTTVLALFSGLVCVCILAFAVGWIIGSLLLLREDKSFFYGPLSEVIEKSRGDQNFITAYVLSNVDAGDRSIGYEGTLLTLVRDTDRFPAKIVLKDASIFYLEFTESGPERKETGTFIDYIAITVENWHNIAFRVFRLDDDVAVSKSDIPPSAYIDPAS
jgi:hypothetical protein